MKHDTKLDGFESMPCRIVGELEDRIESAKKRMRFYVSFLDDYLRGVLPNDLVLLGAPSGVGKTELALNIAASNAKAGRRVHFFALEAAPRELERRTKYAIITSLVYRAQHPLRAQMDYTDWLLGDLEHICGPFNREADQLVLEALNTLQTFYRGKQFTAEDLGKSIESIHQHSDFIVIDHLHYIDSDDENEQRALGDTVKTIRDVSLRIGVPIVLVAHLRKRDQRSRQVVASIDDFHGSSNVTKIATQVVTIEPAPMTPEKWFHAPTFINIAKDRRAGAPRLVAVCNFDRRNRSYAQQYALGRIIGGEWQQLPVGDVPAWAARHHQPIEQVSNV